MPTTLAVPCLWHTKNHGRRSPLCHQACRTFAVRLMCGSRLACIGVSFGRRRPSRTSGRIVPVALGESSDVRACRARLRVYRSSSGAYHLGAVRVAWTRSALGRVCIAWLARVSLGRGCSSRGRVFVSGGRVARVAGALRIAWTLRGSLGREQRFGCRTRRGDSIDRLWRRPARVAQCARPRARCALPSACSCARVRELVRELGHDLEARVAVENLDGADLGFRNLAGLADERQQPARIGLAIAADVEAEPHHLAVVFAPRPRLPAFALG